MELHRFKSISDFHQFRELPKPEHPLISVINMENMQALRPTEVTMTYDFYLIAMKRNFSAKLKYGQQSYDFDEGIMFFLSPGQVLKLGATDDIRMKQTGYMLLVHPDFLWNTTLAKKIGKYEFFDYAVHEALFLSEQEESRIGAIMESIQQEYHSRIDVFSQDVIIAQLELLLTYSQRFYQRQFITRKITNHGILDRLENLLTNAFKSDVLEKNGLPTVQHIAEELNVSPNYLSGMLKTLTGKSTQQHLHDKLIERAKERLSTTSLTVSEIAYELGFEHPQSFSKLFKTKTTQTPLEFRGSFN
jgi:AraC family transcriptional activator of pobA